MDRGFDDDELLPFADTDGVDPMTTPMLMMVPSLNTVTTTGGWKYDDGSRRYVMRTRIPNGLDARDLDVKTESSSSSSCSPPFLTISARRSHEARDGSSQIMFQQSMTLPAGAAPCTLRAHVLRDGLVEFDVRGDPPSPPPALSSAAARNDGRGNEDRRVSLPVRHEREKEKEEEEGEDERGRGRKKGEEREKGRWREKERGRRRDQRQRPRSHDRE